MLNSTDAAILVAFKDFYNAEYASMSGGGAQDLFESWLGFDPCVEQWAGVQCEVSAEDPAVLRVTGLNVTGRANSYLQVWRSSFMCALCSVLSKRHGLSIYNTVCCHQAGSQTLDMLINGNIHGSPHPQGPLFGGISSLDKLNVLDVSNNKLRYGVLPHGYPACVCHF